MSQSSNLNTLFLNFRYKKWRFNVEIKSNNFFSFLREAHWEQKMNNATDYFF